MDVGKRIRDLRERLGWKQGRAAAELSRLVGGEPINPNKFSLWEGGQKKIDRYVVAAISLLHPTDPRGCLDWLLGRAELMPPLPAELERAVTAVQRSDDARNAIAVKDALKGSQGRRRQQKRTGS